MSKHHITRRTFLAGSIVLLAGCASGRKPARPRARRLSANEKLNVAAIGCDGKGSSDIVACAGENVVALCDVDDRRFAKVHEHFPNAPHYSDFRVMLEKEKSIDAVTVSTPDHMHAYIALTAMELGKHVYVQKPLTRSISEARRLLEASRRYGVVTQMGNQGHSGNGVRQFCEWVWADTIGPIREAHIWTNRPIWPQGMPRPTKVDPVPASLNWDAWLGVAPERPYVDKAYHPFVWRGWWDFGAGALGDMGCHIMDPAFWALKLGAPDSVEVLMQEGNNKETFPTKSTIRYDFPARKGMPPVTVYWYDGPGNLPPKPDGVASSAELGEGDNGSYFVGDKGILTTGTYGGRTRFVGGLKKSEVKLPKETIPRIPNEDHSADWLRACKGDPTPPCSNFEYSVPLTEMVLLGNLALATGKKIHWDAKRMKCKGVPEADPFIKPKYRKGWEI